MSNFTEDTIAAISTGAGGAISIVRMSGKNSIAIADQMFKSVSGEVPSSFVSRSLTLGTITTEGFNEQALCVVFSSPKSYTGEDMVEFQCHGGTTIATGVLRECLSHDARLATNGEFTKRAFLNGKMSLSSAEGMMDMINAESDAAVRAGYGLLTGNLSKLAENVEDSLKDLLAEIEVSFDYPEETIEYVTKNHINSELNKIIESLTAAIATSHTGKLIKEGVNVLIVGRPNVGKSSLLNFLLQDERAIVTDVAGTTRDTIEGTFLLNDIKINLIDTAGIQETTDKVEKIGIDKAKSLIASADVILFLVDANRDYTKEDEAIFDQIKNSNFIVIKTKSDKETKCNKHFDNEINISTKTGAGVNELKEKLLELVGTGSFDPSSLIITNERHKNALIKTKDCLSRALDNLNTLTLDLVSADIKQGYSAIGEITGTATSEDIIDEIFKKFCLGK